MVNLQTQAYNCVILPYGYFESSQTSSREQVFISQHDPNIFSLVEHHNCCRIDNDIQCSHYGVLVCALHCPQ